MSRNIGRRIVSLSSVSRSLVAWSTADEVVGCSFTFEQALADAGLTPRHQEEGRNVPMYRTNLPLLPSGSKFIHSALLCYG
jgi:uncharacterized protein YcsI (UPF0317 family)